MKETDKFQIDIYKLSNSSHEYDFEFNNKFFAEFEESIIEEGQGKIKATLEKSESLIKLTININGSIKLICDRSLDEFNLEINSTRSIVFKYGEEEQEINDEIMMITRNTQRLNLAQYVYEFIGIEIPMKKLHPRYEDGSQEDEMVYSDVIKSDLEEKPLDPRWAALKKLK